MGNSQSSAEDRKQTRVSKPKTHPSGRSSVIPSPAKSEFSETGTVTATVPYSPSKDYESAPSPSRKDRRSQQDLRHAIRSQLLSPGGTEIAEESERDQLGLMAATVARSLSRTGNHGPSAKPSLARLQGGSSQVSLATERSVDLETAVALLHELRKTASPDDLVALHQALLPTRSLDQPSPTYESAEEAAEEALGTSPAALIRRKSLAAPGVATRKVKKQEKSVDQDQRMSVHDQLWNRELMHDSPLALLSNMDALGPPAPIGANRCPTPGDMDYSHLGSLEIGSLVVTNGLASPAPSFVSRDFTPRLPIMDRRHDEEYYTASEGGSAHEDIEKSLPSLPPMEPLRPTTSNESTLSLEQPQTPERTTRSVLSSRRSGSPLKREVRVESLDFDDEADSTRPRQPRAVKSAISLAALSENHSLFDNSSFDSSFEEKPSVVRTRPRGESAVSLASEYMAEMPPSPYGTPPRQSLELSPRVSRESSDLQQNDAFEGVPPNYSRVPTRKVSVDSMELQRDDLDKPSLPVLNQAQIDEALGPRRSDDYEDTFEYLDHADVMDHPVSPEIDIPAKHDISPHTALRSHPPGPPALKSALKTSAFGNGRAKTDSGYSSGSSTRGTYEELYYESEHQQQQQQLPALYSTVEMPVQAGAERSSTLDMGPYPDDDQQMRGRSLERELPVPIVDELPTNPEPEKVDRSKSWRKSMRRSLPRMLSSNSTPATAKSTTPEAKSSAKQQKKLQKKRPLSQPPLTMGARRSLTDGDVPRVPSSVSSRFSMRLAASPGMEHLERTYDNPSSSNSRQGSASPSPAVRGGTVVTASYFPDSSYISSSGTVKRLSKAIDHGAIQSPPARRPSTNRRGHRSSSAARDEEDDIIGVADFGTVAQSLGGSPYDAAMPMAQRRLSAVPTQPHQMSTSSRFGPREGWDAETASRFAQMRSRERAAANAASERGLPAGGRPQMGGRPYSYQDRPSSSYNPSPQQPLVPNQRHQPTVQPRPKSMLGSAPQNHQQQHRGAIPQANASRPRTSYTVTTAPLITTFTVATSDPATATTVTSQAPKSSTLIMATPGPRSSTPVKNLVNAFEQRASQASPSPSSQSVERYDWTEQSRLWRERRMQAHTTVQTSSSATGNSKTTNTTIVTTFSPSPSPRPASSVYTLPPTPVEHNPNTQRQSMPARPSPQVLPTSRTSTQDRTPVPSPAPAQKKSPESRFGDSGIFGRYGGGFRHRKDKVMAAVTPDGKRRVTPRTEMVKKDYGIDLGDVPVR